MSTSKRPVINDTFFGSITVNGIEYDHDILITLSGKVKKRKKKLSKAVYGTSHTLSLPEIEDLYQENADGIVIGSGQYGVARLSEEASGFLDAKGCKVVLKASPEAIRDWNHS